MENTARNIGFTQMTEAERIAEALALVHDLAEFTLVCGNQEDLAKWRQLRGLLGGSGTEARVVKEDKAPALDDVVADYRKVAVDQMTTFGFRLTGLDVSVLQDHDFEEYARRAETVAERIYDYLSTKNLAILQATAARR